MIDFSFDIALPRNVEFRSFWNRSWATPFKHKFVELEFHTIESLVGGKFSWTTRRDHAGLDLRLSLAGFCAHFVFYDCRHWDYENNCWKTYE